MQSRGNIIRPEIPNQRKLLYLSLQFSGENRLALVNTLFSTLKKSTPRIFSGITNRSADKKRVAYTLTRHDRRRLVTPST